MQQNTRIYPRVATATTVPEFNSIGVQLLGSRVFGDVGLTTIII